MRCAILVLQFGCHRASRLRRENERLATVAEQWRLSCLAEKERQTEIKDDNARSAALSSHARVVV